MALQFGYLAPNGVNTPDAYARIESLRGNKSKLTVQINIYLNQDAKNENKLPIDIKEYSFIPETTDVSPNYYKQGYNYLKTKPEFSEAIDILEAGQVA